MTSILHLAEKPYTPQENEVLEDSFRTFYRLPSSPKIKRILNTMRENQALIMETITDFTMPSGKVFKVHEFLDRPNGLTQHVIVQDLDSSPHGEITRFDKYVHAELYVLEQFLRETNGNSN